ncbi:MAG TPA: type II toxin-antitoxin system VapC family toxin [Castellaniella sp.]|nr:type II toxin-antitoxin system VapC family toxin [Castellaniella sp.]
MADAKGNKPTLYFDTCCFLDMLQHTLKISPKTDREPHVFYCRKFLEAARQEQVTVYTSTLTVAECICVKDESDPGNHKRVMTDDVKRLIEGMLSSGRSGIMPVQPLPAIVKKARDLEWAHGARFSTMDSLHIATALHMKCDYFVTTDGTLDRKGGQTIVKALGLGFCRADSLAHLLTSDSRQLPIEPDLA